MWRGKELKRQGAVEGLEGQDNLQVEKLTINQRACWFNRQIKKSQLYVDNYKSLEGSPNDLQLVRATLCSLKKQ